MPSTSLRYVVTGAPGGGKTPLIEQLALRGFVGVPEPSRVVIAEHGLVDGLKVYDRDPTLFLGSMLARSIRDFEDHADADRPVFFDRGLPDLVCYAGLFGLDPSGAEEAARAHRYNDLVFVLPSWAEIYVTDEDRRMTFDDASAFGDALRDVYVRLGYSVVDVPRASIAERTEFVMQAVSG